MIVLVIDIDVYTNNGVSWLYRDFDEYYGCRFDCGGFLWWTFPRIFDRGGV